MYLQRFEAGSLAELVRTAEKVGHSFSKGRVNLYQRVIADPTNSAESFSVTSGDSRTNDLLSLAAAASFIRNNVLYMRNDSCTLKDAAVSGNEHAHNFFLPRDTTLDELIASRSRFVRAVDLWALSLLTHHLIRKLDLVDPRRYPGFDQAVHATVLVLKSAQAQDAIDPLPRHLAEVGFAAHYFLREGDLIPDKTPEVGFADDFAIFKQVFARNRLEIDNVIHKS